MKPGWESVKIGDLCDLNTGGTPSRAKAEYFDGGDIKWLVSGDIHQREIFDCEGRITQEGMENSNARILPINSVIIALNGQGKTRGTVALLRTIATCNQSLVSISPRKDAKILPEYLYYNLNGRYDEIRRITGDAGNERRGLNMPLIRQISFPLPPLEEQQRIVAILDEAFEGLDRARANAEANLQSARDIFNAELSRIFERTLSNEPVKEFDELARETLIGLVRNKDEQGNQFKYPYLKMQDIQNNDKLGELSGQRVNCTVKEAERYAVKKGDFLFNTRNSRELVGKSCVITDDFDELTVFNNNIMRARFISGANPEFIAYAFKSWPIKRQLEEMKSGTTSVVAIYYNSLKSLKIPIPSMAMQAEIEQILSELENYVSNLQILYKLQIEDTDDLQQSLLQKAFAGELT